MQDERLFHSFYLIFLKYVLLFRQYWMFVVLTLSFLLKLMERFLTDSDFFLTYIILHIDIQ